MTEGSLSNKMSSPQQGISPIRTQRAAINPYLSSVYRLLLRIRWDLSPLSWRSRARMKRWRNRYAGRKAVIVCNGPSLLQSDLSLLHDTFTFGMNKINLLFDRSDFRPSCIVAINSLVLEQNAPFYNETHIPLFLPGDAARLVRFRPNVTLMHMTDYLHFARDCSVSVVFGHTVTHTALQLAFHMGFTQVALIGCDHHFATAGPANAAVTSGATDASHFDPRYFAGGVQWHLPDLAGSEYNYAKAKEVFEAFGRRVFNATVGGKLEIFPRISLEEFLALPDLPIDSQAAPR